MLSTGHTIEARIEVGCDGGSAAAGKVSVALVVTSRLIRVEVSKSKRAQQNREKGLTAPSLIEAAQAAVTH